MAPEQGLSEEDKKKIAANDATTATDAGAVGGQALAPSAYNLPRSGSRSTSPRRIRTSWVGHVAKKDLECYLTQCGQDATGIVEEQRRRLSTFINSGTFSEELRQRILEWEQRHTPKTNDNDPPAVPPLSANERPILSVPLPLQIPHMQHELPVLTPSYSVQTMRAAPAHEFDNNERPNIGIWQQYEPAQIDDRTFKKVRKWGIKFSGQADAIDFIERIEELALSQNVPLEQIPVTLAESLTGDALAWWRNRRHTWGSWAAFKHALLEHFLPGNYWDDLEDAIRARQQGADEPFKRYVLAIETLMRHADMTTEEKLARIYKNSLPAIRILIKREEFSTLEKLTRLATHIEVTREPEPDRPKKTPALTIGEITRNTQPTRGRGYRTTPNETRPQTLGPIIDPQNACRRCGQLGHRSTECPNASVLFCWNCGKRDVRTNQCCRRPPVNQTALRHTTVREQPSNTLYMGTPRAVERNIIVDIFVKNRSWPGLIDTGSWSSFINTKVSKQLQSMGFKPTKAHLSVRMANGQEQHINESIEATLQTNCGICPVRLLVLPRAIDPVILGMDVLEQAGGSFSIGGNAVAFEPQHNSAKPTTRRSRIIPKVRTIGEANPTTMGNAAEVAAPIPTKPFDFEQTQVKEFLDHELRQFEKVHGLSNAAEHHIIMKDDRPIKQRYFPRNPAMQQVINEKIDELLAKDCIEPSHSAYSAPVVLARKKDGKWRLCIDYRQLNARSVPDAYPLPRMHHILDMLRNAKYVSSLDLKDGYWQIPMHIDSRKYTAFTVPGRGLYQWKVMPFGLHSAPATFQRAIDRIIGPDLEPRVFVYLDDIIVTSSTVEEHMSLLKIIFQRLRGANLRINAAKCEFFKRETKYLGHIISERGIHTDPDKVAAILALQPPTNVREVRRCLGVASWYRRFVPNFSTLVQPITELLKKGKHFKWGPTQQEAFDELKQRFTMAPVLACPDFSQTFCLQTDASDTGLGAVLTQEIDEVERVIAYASRHLNPAERNYSATEKECLAIIWAIRKMREYLEGYHFVVITDHQALKWLNSIESPSGRIARWALELQQYHFEIRYRRGKLNVIADALSRQPTQLQRVAGQPDDDNDHDDHSMPTTPDTWDQRKKKEVLSNPDQFPEYTVQNDHLYRYFSTSSTDNDVSPWKLCAGPNERQRILQENHDEPTAGHQGIKKTITRIAQRYYWPGMFRDISRYVQRCQQCQKYKASQQAPPGKMLTHLAEEPWATICMDFVGPLPRSKKGNTMLLVMQDKFSKWVELIPLRSATADSVVKGFRTNILARFGVPKVIISDNGSQFTSALVTKAFQELGIRHQYTAPYTPQENAVERANRVVKTMIAQYCEQNQRTWDELIPELMLAINTGTSEVTGHSPAFLTQGREPRLPRALFDEVTPGTGKIPEDSTDKAQRLQLTFEFTRRQLQQASQNQSRHYNLRRRNWKPQIGQLVWIRQHQLSKAIDGFAAKLAPKYGGPYKVIQIPSPSIVKAQSLANKKHVRTAHLHDLKVYHESDATPNTTHSQ